MRARSIIPFLVCVLAAAGCSLFDGGGDDGPQGPPPEIPGRLVFSAPDEEGNQQIFSSFTNGTDLRQLTGLEQASAFSPAWSPDGGQIVFASTLLGISGFSHLYLMDADGDDQRLLRHTDSLGREIPVAGNNPKWSPDGRKIAYESCIDCEMFGKNVEIFVYDIETQQITQITDHPGRDFSPKWAGKNAVSFITNRDYLSFEETQLFDLYEFKLVDKSLKRITTDGKSGIWIWDPGKEGYLIRQNKEPLIWYWLNPMSMDTLEVVDPDQFNVEDAAKVLSPIKFDETLNTLWLLEHRHPQFQFHFYKVETDELIKTFRAEQMSGFDWQVKS